MRTIIDFALMIIVVTAFVAVVCASAYLLGWIYKRKVILMKPFPIQPIQPIQQPKKGENKSNDFTVIIDMPPSYEEAKQQTKEKVSASTPFKNACKGMRIAHTQ